MLNAIPSVISASKKTVICKKIIFVHLTPLLEIHNKMRYVYFPLSTWRGGFEGVRNTV